MKPWPQNHPEHGPSSQVNSSCSHLTPLHLTLQVHLESRQSPFQGNVSISFLFPFVAPHAPLPIRALKVTPPREQRNERTRARSDPLAKLQPAALAKTPCPKKLARTSASSSASPASRLEDCELCPPTPSLPRVMCFCATPLLSLLPITLRQNCCGLARRSSPPPPLT